MAGAVKIAPAARRAGTLAFTSPLFRMAAPKDLDWTRDELVLALDLALRYDAFTSTDSTVARLSRELKALPIHPPEQRLPNFRSIDAVAMRLNEFAEMKRKRGGRGGASALTADVWSEFDGNLSRVRAEAARVRERFSAGEAA